MICKHCGTALERNGELLVDAVSGDAGGTYDYCPANPVGTEDERLHEMLIEPGAEATEAELAAYYDQTHDLSGFETRGPGKGGYYF